MKHEAHVRNRFPDSDNNLMMKNTCCTKDFTTQQGRSHVLKQSNGGGDLQHVGHTMASGLPARLPGRRGSGEAVQARSPGVQPM